MPDMLTLEDIWAWINREKNRPESNSKVPLSPSMYKALKRTYEEKGWPIPTSWIVVKPLPKK